MPGARLPNRPVRVTGADRSPPNYPGRQDRECLGFAAGLRYAGAMTASAALYRSTDGRADGCGACVRLFGPVPLLLASLQALALLAGIPRSGAAQQTRADTIVVTAGAYPIPFDGLARTVTILTRDEIRSLPVRSLAELLDYTAGVDVRSRGPYGAQADFSIRGSSYSQVLVLVDGIRMNDSQTGHHNADLPVALSDIERVEVLSGPGSALYGADAFGGIINIITSRKDRRLHASGSIGQFGTLEARARASLQRGVLSQSVALFGSRSSGFMFDRDFRTAGFHARTDIGDRSSLMVGYADKEFGANGFYGPSPSREWTDQLLVAAEHTMRASARWQGKMQASYRTHGDRFLWDIRRPGFYENRHRTHALGFSFKAQRTLSEGVMLNFGGEAGTDRIASSNLGNHSYARTSAFAEMQFKLGRPATVYSGFRYDRYSNFGSAASPSLSLSWWALPRLRFRASAGHAFRIPTFTELYYRDPNNEGSATLKPERAWAFEIGTDIYPAAHWLAAAAFFARRESDTIDWVRRSPAEKWRAANMGGFTAQGVELSLQRAFGGAFRLVQIEYAYVGGSAGAADYHSKYVLDYVRHSGGARLAAALPAALTFGQGAGYRKHRDGRDYLVIDARLARAFGRAVLSLEGANILGIRYQEIIGVDMPGRRLALRLEWSPGP